MEVLSNCPHCGLRDQKKLTRLFQSLKNEAKSSLRRQSVTAFQATCNSCKQAITWVFIKEDGEFIGGPLIFPRSHPQVAPCPSGAPEDVAKDYREAAAVLHDSPNAAALMARRCLQKTIRNHIGIRRHTLAAEISAAVEESSIPSHLIDSSIFIRDVGNASAHPEQDASDMTIEADESSAIDCMVELHDILKWLFEQAAKKKRIAGKSAELKRRMSEAKKARKPGSGE
jgi:hypothetical protein